MTILGSILGVLLLVLRRVKKIPRRFIYAFYSLIYIRLLCPFGFTNGFSFLNLLPKGSIRLVNVFGEVVGTKQLDITLANSIQSAISYEPMAWKSDSLTRFYEIGSVLWLAVCSIIILCYCIMYLMAKKELMNAIRLDRNIYQSNAVNVPMVVGILRPRIILPENIPEGEGHLKYLLAHEEIHISRKDNLWRLIAIVITSIHWFNPLVWIILKYFFIDMELACDEKTIHDYDQKERMEYAAALLEFSPKEPVVFATSFSGGNVKIRMKRVIHFHKLTVLSSLMFVLLFILFVVFFLSNK